MVELILLQLAEIAFRNQAVIALVIAYAVLRSFILGVRQAS